MRRPMPRRFRRVPIFLIRYPPASCSPSAAACPAGTEPTSNRSAPRFRVIRPHAEGGLGRVLVARDEELNREVALKEIKDRFAHDPDKASLRLSFATVGEAKIVEGVARLGQALLA